MKTNQAKGAGWRAFGLLLLLALPWPAAAQQLQGAQWYFGEGCHLDFTSGQPVARLDSPIRSRGAGQACVSDARGQMLFFANGDELRNRTFHLLRYPPGVSVLNTSATLLIEEPGDSTRFHAFFTTSALGFNTSALKHLVIDRRLNGGLGGILPPVNNEQFLLDDSIADDNMLTAALHANGRDYWIIAHNRFDDGFRAYPFTGPLIGQPVVSHTGISYQSINNIHYPALKMSPNSELLTFGGGQARQVFRFNRATGVLSLLYDLGPYPEATYAITFSPDNTKLYSGGLDAIYRTNPASSQFLSALYQYDLTAGSPAAVLASRQRILYDSTNSGITDIQAAVDGKLYFVAYLNIINPPHLPDPVTQLGVINCPGASGPACDARFAAVDLLGRVSSRVLPTQNQTLFRNAARVQASANPGVLCRGDSTRLVAYGGGATTVQWFPSQGLSADTVRNPVAHPLQTTTYTVIAQRACGPPDTARVTVVVTQQASVRAAGRDTTVCAGATLTLGGAADPAAAYLWYPARYLSSARAANPTLQAPPVPRDTVLTYVLTAACTPGADTVRIRVLARPAVTPLPALTACPGDTLQLGGALPLGTLVQWSPPTYLDNPASAQPRLRLPPRPPAADTTLVYYRAVGFPGSPCAALDSVVVRVAAAPLPPRLRWVSVDTTNEAQVVGAYRAARRTAFPSDSLQLEAQAPGQAPRLIASVATADSVFVATAELGAAYQLRGEGQCASALSDLHRPVHLTGALTDSLGSAHLRWSAYRGWETDAPGPVRYSVLRRLGTDAAFRLLWSSNDTTWQAPAPPTRLAAYRVQALAPDGRRSASNRVTFETDPGLRSYNILTPDGDGLNDAFVVENLALYPGTELTVYNRWGRLIFRAADYRNDWRAEGVEAGLYFYRLHPTAGSEVKGWVEVVR